MYETAREGGRERGRERATIVRHEVEQLDVEGARARLVHGVVREGQGERAGGVVAIEKLPPVEG